MKGYLGYHITRKHRLDKNVNHILVRLKKEQILKQENALVKIIYHWRKLVKKRALKRKRLKEKKEKERLEKQRRKTRLLGLAQPAESSTTLTAAAAHLMKPVLKRR